MIQDLFPPSPNRRMYNLLYASALAGVAAIMALTPVSLSFRVGMVVSTAIVLGVSYTLYTYNDHCVATGSRESPACKTWAQIILFLVAISVITVVLTAARAADVAIALGASSGSKGRAGGRK